MKKTVLFCLLTFLALNSTFASATNKKLNLLIFETATNQADQTSVYFDLGTVTTFRFPEDVQKTLDSAQTSPQIYSFSSDNVTCYSSGFGNFTKTVAIPVGIRAQTGMFVISAYAVTNFDPASFILLEDKLTGSFTDLKTSSYSFQVTQAGIINNRFVLHITYPPVISSVQAGCNNNDGVVLVTQDTTIAWSSCTLYDSSNVALVNFTNAKGNVTFNNLAEGSYYVSFVFGTDTVNKDISITGNQIISSINSSLTYAAVNQVINFDAIGTHADQFAWDFGDSTFITGIAHPTYAYNEPGTYTVTLKSSNTFGCIAYAHKTVYISLASGVTSLSSDVVSIISSGKDVRIAISDLSGSDYQYQLYNISGQMLTNGHITSSDFLLTLNGKASGIYIVAVTNDTGAATSKKVFLAE